MKLTEEHKIVTIGILLTFILGLQIATSSFSSSKQRSDEFETYMAVYHSQDKILSAMRKMFSPAFEANLFLTEKSCQNILAEDRNKLLLSGGKDKKLIKDILKIKILLKNINTQIDEMHILSKEDELRKKERQKFYADLSKKHKKRQTREVVDRIACITMMLLVAIIPLIYFSIQEGIESRIKRKQTPD